MKHINDFIIESQKDNSREIVYTEYNGKNKYVWTEKVLGEFIIKKCNEDNSYWFSKEDIQPLLSMKTRDEIENYLKKNQKKIVHPLYDYFVSEGTDGKNLKMLFVRGESIEENELIPVLSQALMDFNLKKYIKFK